MRLSQSLWGRPCLNLAHSLEPNLKCKGSYPILANGCAWWKSLVKAVTPTTYWQGSDCLTRCSWFTLLIHLCDGIVCFSGCAFAWVLRMDSFVVFCKGGHVSTHCIYFATLKDHFIILLSLSNEPKVRVKSCRKCGKFFKKGLKGFFAQHSTRLLDKSKSWDKYTTIVATYKGYIKLNYKCHFMYALKIHLRLTLVDQSPLIPKFYRHEIYER